MKPEVYQNVAQHALPTARDFFLSKFYLPGQCVIHPEVTLCGRQDVEIKKVTSSRFLLKVLSLKPSKYLGTMKVHLLCVVGSLKTECTCFVLSVLLRQSALALCCRFS